MRSQKRRSHAPKPKIERRDPSPTTARLLAYFYDQMDRELEALLAVAAQGEGLDPKDGWRFHVGERKWQRTVVK